MKRLGSSGEQKAQHRFLTTSKASALMLRMLLWLGLA